MNKKLFMKDEFWMLTINASFGHVKVYKDNPKEQDRITFKNGLRKKIEDIIQSQYDGYVNDENHISNINLISKFTENYHEILAGGKLHFGVCQKLLNLYLKYLWCMDDLMHTPPHFPIDRIIQNKLNIKNPVSWTKGMGENEYKSIVDEARELLSLRKENNLAELELQLFNEKMNS